MWAILSGIEGNIAAYEAVLADIKRQRVKVEALYILGDIVAANQDSEQVIKRIQNPLPGELEPQVCFGWWEEQCFALHGLGSTAEPTELIERFGKETAKLLWDSVSRETVQWLRNCHFGFFELDCLLIHGSTVSVSDELTPETLPWQMLDRLQRVQANHLFCGRSGQVFEYQLQGGSVNSSVMTLDRQQPVQTITAPKRRVVGVGNVGKEPGKATYTLYSPKSDFLEFKTVFYGNKKGSGN
ncbi:MULTISPECIES: metallophosphoesterase family protein [Moorena]|uniref:Metallophosphoesterase family protein n=1 Tax=Moorena producens (strain JHB) TaxID=1454205 RepID=A0A1D9G1C0_MOOP1|nr:MULTISPECIES: metallophosphoesterase family protein [Moorena]NEQ12484.1 metallophosphoesterase [Moorena sp. SIO3E2]NES80604.1 metallophosphoesterase [Moorena sp. SIO2B7]AOY81220.1 metallophosphoesterase family protein [Moorena producens JHB]NEP31155.1 metallophosphoesterase [Moorena sp. SIO3B2]NES40254.1 metallophosphoesterase [Moorena sp. SIO2C4]